MSDPATPKSKTLENFLREVHSDIVGALLQEAESSTTYISSSSFVKLWLGTIDQAKEVLQGAVPAALPSFPFKEHLERVEEAERAFHDLEPIENDVTTPDQGRALLAAVRTTFDSMGAVLRALEERKAAERERAAHAREVRARRLAKETPAKERERIAAAVDAARGVKEELERKRYFTARNIGNHVAFEPAVNSIPRGVKEVPLVSAPHDGNVLGFAFRQTAKPMEEGGPPVRFLENLKRETLTGGEVLGPVERQVFLAILNQAGRQNPADLVGVSISAYAALHDITYTAAKKAIEKAMKSLVFLGPTFAKSYADKWGLPTHFWYFDSVYGELSSCKEAEGFYFVQLGTTMIRLLSGGHAIQFPLFPTVSLQANPNADLFAQLFALNRLQNLGKPNENVVSIQRLAQAAGLLRDKKHLDRARAIVERDLRAVERSGSDTHPATFTSHAYTRDGATISARKAVAMPPREWLKLNVKVEWSEGALDYSRKERAIEARKDRLAIAEAKAKKGSIK